MVLSFGSFFMLFFMSTFFTVFCSPVIVNPIQNQHLLVDEMIYFPFPNDTFSSDDPISLSVNTSLPDWLSIHQDGTNLFSTFVSNGVVRGIGIVGDTVYLSDGINLKVIDVSVLKKPKYIASVGEGKPLSLIVFEEEKLIYLAEIDGICIYDISNPHEPIRVKNFTSLYTYRFHLWMERDILLTSTVSDRYLQIFNISDPLNPKEIGSCSFCGGDRYIYHYFEHETNEHFAYTTDSSLGLGIVNITNFSNPNLLSRTYIQNLYGIIVREEIVFVSNGVELLAFRSKNKTQLVEVEIPSPQPLSYYYYLKESPYDPDVLYVGGNGLSTLFFNNSLELVLISQIKQGLQTGDFIFRGNKTLYFSDVNNGFQIYNISDRQNLQYTGFLNPSSTVQAVRVSNSMEYAYITGDLALGLVIVDITTSPPTAVAVCNTGSKGINGGLNLDIDEHFAYLADGNGGLSIVDISKCLSKEDSYLVNTYKGDEGDYSITHVRVRGDIAFVCHKGYGVRILNISNRYDPFQIDSVRLDNDDAYSLVLNGDHLFISIENKGFYIYDIRIPSKAAFVSFTTTGKDITGMAVVGQYLFVTAVHVLFNFGIFDISDKYNPFLVGSLNVTKPLFPTTVINKIYDIVVDKETAYVFASSDGIISIDVTHKNNPSVIEYFKEYYLGSRYARKGVLHNLHGDSFLFVANVNDLLVFSIGRMSLSGKPSFCDDYIIGISAQDSTGVSTDFFEIIVRKEGYYDKKCEVYQCNGVFSNQSSLSLCSNHGTCEEPSEEREEGFCNCAENYYGLDCKETQCHGIFSNVTTVCSSNGKCNIFGICNCSEHYQSSYCNITSCNGVMNDGSDGKVVCSGHGTCEKYNHCDCTKPLYFGEKCDITTCSKVLSNNTGIVCSGAGNCVDVDECVCFPDFKKSQDGSTCVRVDSESGGQGTSELIIASSVGGGVLFLIFVSCLCCYIFFLCCCCILIIFMFFFFVLVSGSGIMYYTQRKRVDLKLDEFDKVLGESLIQNSAQIKINESLFEIKYENLKLSEAIGHGGSSSIVFKAFWKTGGMNVAFKCFQTFDLFCNQDDFNKFEEEVMIMSSIRHPNIVSFFGCSIHPPRVGIVMEFCEKGDLKNFLEDIGKDISIGERFRILRQCCNGFAYLHEKKIIHRDVKSENILLSSDITPKITDFGLSKIEVRMSRLKSKNVGTSYYIAPEVVLGNIYSEKCDVFSFSIVMWEVICMNFEPYKDKSAYNIEYKIANNREFRPYLDSLPKDGALSEKREEMMELLKRGWNHDDFKRPTFTELVKILEEFDEISSNLY